MMFESETKSSTLFHQNSLETGVGVRGNRGFASMQYKNPAGLRYKVAGNPRGLDRSRAGPSTAKLIGRCGVFFQFS